MTYYVITISSRFKLNINKTCVIQKNVNHKHSYINKDLLISLLFYSIIDQYSNYDRDKLHINYSSSIGKSNLLTIMTPI